MREKTEIKPPWPIARLGDVAKTSSGGTPKRGVAAYYGGGIPWVKSGELGDSTVYETSETISKEGLDGSSAKLFPKGTLCVALYGATVGKLGILGVDAATNQAVCGIFLPDNVDTRFAYRYLESKRRDLIEMGKGGAQPNISQEILRDLPFPILQLDEQKAIVAEIEKQFTRLDAGVAALRRVLANLKRYRAAVLKAACEGRLVPTEAELARRERRGFETGEALLGRILEERRKKWNGRGKYKEPAGTEAANLPKLAVGWKWASLDQLLMNITDGDHLPPPQTDSGVPFLVIGNVRTGKVTFEDTRYVGREYYDSIEPNRKPRRGDILYTLVGSYGIALSVDQDREFCIQRHIGVLRPHLLSPTSYLVHILNSPSIFQQATSSATGTAQKTVPLAGLRRFSIPLPPLRDDGLSYGDYVEQLTFLLFLKMADEQSKPPFNKPSPIPKGHDWPALLAVDGDALEIHYRHTLEELGKRTGMLGVIFRKAQNRIQDPAKLRRLIVELIDKEEWSSLDADVKGDAYEGLLQKNAEDVKGGAGQYFTPRALIATIVDVIAPQPGQTICDPAYGPRK